MFENPSLSLSLPLPTMALDLFLLSLRLALFIFSIKNDLQMKYIDQEGEKGGKIHSTSNFFLMSDDCLEISLFLIGEESQ